MASVGERYQLARSQAMVALGLGLTKIYNRFHSPEEGDNRIFNLRALQVEIDQVSIEAYGWTDIKLDHDFYKVGSLPDKDNLRFTISEAARIEVLKRLSELNKARYEEEVAQGLHGSDEKSARSPSKKSSSKSKASSTQTKKQTGFDFHEDLLADTSAVRGNQWGDKATDQILAWLEEHKNWFVRQAILTGCGAEPTAWDAAINELIADQFVEIKGSGDQARYRAKG
jgi:hypothetical protein